MAREVLKGLEASMQMILNSADGNVLSYKQKQKANAEFLNSLILHPRYRERLCEALLEKPLEGLKLVASTFPKELHIEENSKQLVVFLTDQQSPENWIDAYVEQEKKTLSTGLTADQIMSGETLQ